ncbi:MAG: cysteine synthase family protein, partial [Proteobacteria bacterium]|nr:cysteine synthase family protein [Pseudomonadota bacterium]
MSRYNTILDTIGRTPVVRLNALSPPGINVYAKLEAFNPMGSVKDRLAIGVIEDAEKRGTLKPGQTVVEATSGNTGIGLAWICAVKGYRLVLTMPESMSLERRQLLEAYGAEIVLTPAEAQMDGAIARAREIAAKTPGAFTPQQFDNPANIDVHVRTTAQEILRDFDQPLDALITGVGTGGHITACARVLKKEWPNLKVFAVEPTLSPVISGGEPGPHP